MSNTMQTINSSIKIKKSKNSVIARMWEYRAIYLLLLPAVVFYIVFSYFPMYGITIAFKNYMFSKGIFGSEWVGFDNFKVIFALDKFWQVFFNTIYVNILRLIWGFPAPIILALLLNEIRKDKFKKLIQTVVYLPHFISWVTIAGITLAMLSVDDGIVNRLIMLLGGEKIDFMTNPDYFRTILVSTGIWKEVGWGTIIYFAAICGISPELYEAAIVDGAGRWKQMLYITLPSLAPTISILLILNMGSMLSGGFDQVFNLYNPMVYSTGDVIDTYIYRIGLGEGKFSIATAVGLFLSIINFTILFTVDKAAKKVGGVGIY